MRIVIPALVLGGGFHASAYPAKKGASKADPLLEPLRTFYDRENMLFIRRSTIPNIRFSLNPQAKAVT